MKNLLKHTLLILSCVLLTALGFTILNADSTTTIGLDINTGDITSTGTITSHDLTIEKSDDTTLTIYSNTDSPTADDKLLIVQKGTTPSELFSVDEDGDVIIANDLSINNDLAITGNVTSGTWQGTAIVNDYIGTEIDTIKLADGSVSNTEFQYLNNVSSALQTQLDNKIAIPGSSAQGDVLFRNDTDWTRLAAGTSGQFLKSQGASADPSWTNVTRSATFVVATSAAVNGSSILSQQQADYVCDGTDDQVQIQAAIDALPDQGGRIILLEGNFVISDTIHLYRDVAAWFNVFIQGQGLYATTICLASDSNCDMIDVNVLDNPSGWKGVADLRLYGNKNHQTSGDGIHVYQTGTGTIYDSRFRNVFIENVKEIGFHLHGVWGCYIDNCLAEFCDGDGLYLNGAENYVYGFHSSGNAGNGIKVKGAENALSNLRVVSNEEHGIRLDNCYDSNINGAYIADWGGAVMGGYYGISIISSCHNNNLSNINIYGNNDDYTNIGVNADCDFSTFGNMTIRNINYRPFRFYTNSSYNTLMNSVIQAGTISNIGIGDDGTGNEWNNQHSDLFMDLLAASTTAIHAAITGTGAEQEVTTAITNPDVARNISITTTNVTSPSGNVTITGVDAKGNSTTEDITISAGGTAYGSKAFATVSKITIPAGVTADDTVAVGISDKLGLSNIIYASGDVYKVKKNNADATIGTVNTTYGTVDCANITGGDDFTIYYKSNLNIIN